MVRRLWLVFLAAPLALAQDEEREEGEVTIDEAPEEAPEARPAREAGSDVGTVTVVGKKIYSLALPEDWVLVEAGSRGAELAWEVLLPGSTHPATLKLIRLKDGNPRSSPYYRAKWTKEESADANVEVRMEPCPRAVCRRSREGTEWIDVHFYRSILNNPYEFVLSCAASDFVQAEADMLTAVVSFTADVKLWPPIPDGYKVSQHGTWTFATAPNVSDSIAPLVKTVKEQEGRFRQLHGSLPKSDAPLVVLVHMMKADGALIEPGVAESVFDCWADSWKRRLFATPFGNEDDEKASHLAYVAQQTLLMAKYGDMRPGWIWAGECVVAQAEAATGKALPSLEEGFAGWRTELELRLPSELDLENPAYVRQESWPRECFFYIAALRHGKYKKQYRAFLEECAATGDCVGAAARHLGAIDQEDLRSSTRQFMTTIKVVKRKEEKPRK